MTARLVSQQPPIMFWVSHCVQLQPFGYALVWGHTVWKVAERELQLQDKYWAEWSRCWISSRYKMGVASRKLESCCVSPFSIMDSLLVRLMKGLTTWPKSLHLRKTLEMARPIKYWAPSFIYWYVKPSSKYQVTVSLFRSSNRGASQAEWLISLPF